MGGCDESQEFKLVCSLYSNYCTVDNGDSCRISNVTDHGRYSFSLQSYAENAENSDSKS